jgi:circadian clock protein KaiC
MTKKTDPTRVTTGVDHLDAILNGGLPRGSATVLAGAPGSGKTILTQQICFHNASPRHRVLCFTTLSEPVAKTLRHLRPFSFFDTKKVGGALQFVDLGVMLRTKGLEATSALIMQHVKKVKPAIVVIDSFKVFDDLAGSKEELRKFIYEIAINLMAWEATVLILGEYSAEDYESSPLFSIVDGLIVMSQREVMGEQQRFLRVVKMRGTDHNREELPFVINADGIEVFAPRVAIARKPVTMKEPVTRCKTHLGKLDEILGPGIPWGSSLLIAGVAGTGKTVLSLEFFYRGAMAGEKGILFSFEETDDRLLSAAKGLGWDLQREIDRGMVEIVFIPQPEIMVEAHLLMMQQRITRLKARRVVIDSVSVFLHKVKDPQLSREKIFHLCSIVQNAQAVGFFPTDVPYGSTLVSRFGVEETVVDGVIILTALEEGQERQRYIEIYKLRNTAHLKGRHNLLIGEGGVSIFPRYADESRPSEPPPALVSAPLASGIPGLDALVGGGLLKRSVTLVSGSTGVGKTTFALQFVLEGARRNEAGLYVTLEEGPEQLLASAGSLGLPLQEAVDAGLVEILYVSREYIRAGQFLTVLADRLQALKASRVVVDSAPQMMTGQMAPEEFRNVLAKLANRFKTLDITSVLTLEAAALFSTERVTEMELSAIADNLLMLRYKESGGQLAPTVTIVKTRGSDHDRGTHAITIAKGGIRVGKLLTELSAPRSELTVRDPATKKRKPRKAK